MATLTITTDRPGELMPLLEVAVDREIKHFQFGLERTKSKIEKFEQYYKVNLSKIMDNVEERERIGDMELVEWEGETQTLNLLQKKLQQLRNIKICE